MNSCNGDQARGGDTRLPGHVFMKGTLRQFDPDARSLTVSWSLSYVDTDNQTLLDLGTDPSNTVHFNIYRDVKAVPEDRNSTKVDTTDVLRIDNITEVPIAVLGAHPWDDVMTSIDFTQAVSDDPWTQPLFGISFDNLRGRRAGGSPRLISLMIFHASSCW